MNNNKTLILIVVAVVLVGGFIYYNSTVPKSPSQVSTSTDTNDVNPPSGNKTWTIDFDGTAFSPKEVTAKKGDTVIWKNSGSRDIRPASAMHPTHQVYPGSDIKKCGTSDASKIFDACNSLKSGESYSFTFNEVGEWGYHDHMQATLFGKVIVTE